MQHDDNDSGTDGDFNPYSPPPVGSETPPKRDFGQGHSYPLASRWLRLGGMWMDALIAFPLLIWGMVTQDQALTNFGAIVGLGVSVFQWVLIARTGQSIAKRMFNMKIIRTDGSAVDFRSGVIMRAWVPLLVGAIPKLGPFFGFADGLFIFNKERRCIHDMIADTQVIDISGSE